MTYIDSLLQERLTEFYEKSRRLTVLTGNYLRPHVLWFDEQYNEKYFKLDSSMRVAKETGLLLIVGTSGATTLPQRIVESVLSRQGIIIDINPNENYFSALAQKKKNGYWLKGKSSDVLPEFVQFFQSLQPKILSR